MNTIETSPALTRQLILKIAFWIFLVVFAARFVIRDALPYFGFSEDVFGRFWEMKWWLTGHITGGLLAIAIGPFQFWPAFRNKYLHVHRWLGRFYLGGILLASISSIGLIFTTAAAIHWTWAVALGSLSFAWLCTGTMAYLAIRMRRINMHKEWMIRSYVVTFGFVLFRWMVDLPFLLDVSPEFIFRGPTVGWACWVFPLFITEMILSWNRDKK